MTSGNRFRAETDARLATAGLGLLEVVVALAILGLVAGVLVDGFGRVVEVRGRLSQRLQGSGEAQLGGDWFRQSVNAIVPGAVSTDRLDGAVFRGSPRRFVAVTRMPLDGMTGEPVRCLWEIVPDERARGMRLRYVTDGGRTLDVASWKGEQGGFLYYGRDGIWRRTWPPSAREASQLPLLVRAEIGQGALPRTVIAAPRSHDLLRPAADEAVAR